MVRQSSLPRAGSGTIVARSRAWRKRSWLPRSTVPGEAARLSPGSASSASIQRRSPSTVTSTASAGQCAFTSFSGASRYSATCLGVAAAAAGSPGRRRGAPGTDHGGGEPLDAAAARAARSPAPVPGRPAARPAGRAARRRGPRRTGRSRAGGAESTAVSRVESSPLTVGRSTISRIRAATVSSPASAGMPAALSGLLGVESASRRPRRRTVRWRPRHRAGPPAGRRAGRRGSSRGRRQLVLRRCLGPRAGPGPTPGAVRAGVLDADVEDGGGSRARRTPRSSCCARTRSPSTSRLVTARTRHTLAPGPDRTCPSIERGFPADPARASRSSGGEPGEELGGVPGRARGADLPAVEPALRRSGRKITRAGRRDRASARPARASWSPSATSVADRGAMRSASARSDSRTPSRSQTPASARAWCGERSQGARASASDGAGRGRPASAAR